MLRARHLFNAALSMVYQRGMWLRGAHPTARSLCRALLLSECRKVWKDVPRRPQVSIAHGMTCLPLVGGYRLCLSCSPNAAAVPGFLSEPLALEAIG